MKRYINISVQINKQKIIDVRVPRYITIKKMLELLGEAYALPIIINNPVVRIEQNNYVLRAFDTLKTHHINDGSFLKVERL